ncbi:MAG: phosphoenolpyruvate synthase [Candidatus Paceibacterota bacterium]|jgi:pyruvate,water dikinase
MLKNILKRNKKESTNTMVVPMEKLGIKDVAIAGGKNASLGEMLKNLKPKGVNIPSGFVVTADAYRYFLKETKLDEFIKNSLKDLDTSNLKNLAKRGKEIREKIKKSNFPDDLKKAIAAGYVEMEKTYGKNIDVAVRSSATAEDLPGASFAGEHETYLGIRGINQVMEATRAAMASLFTNRAISYRVDKKFDHLKVALSVGVQKMVRSDMGASGIMFTLDTESGFPNVIIINASWGLGEMIVQGEVTPDEFFVFKGGLNKPDQKLKPIISKHLGVKNKKMIYSATGQGIKQTKVISTTEKEENEFVLSDEEILKLATWGYLIEEHYSNRNKKWTPMDIEWAKDGKTGELFIVQARPETIHADRDFTKVKEYVRSDEGPIITKGASVGSRIATGSARVILETKKLGEFKKGEILVTGMTDPDWEPIMKIASAIVTDKGGRTSHAAIVSRELGIPCVVGTENATQKIKTGDKITVDTTGSEGIIFRGIIKYKIVENDVKTLPKIHTKLMVNIATPETAFEKSFLPNDGVGLAREEFIIASAIGIHPLALLNYQKMPARIKSEIDKKTRGWKEKDDFYVDNLAYGIAKIGAAFYPKPVIVRFSDFKTNEYRTLLGGEFYEPNEENPMTGWRGASRYYDPKFEAAFKLECLAMKKVRDEMGLDNVIPMVPFCRTEEEGIKVLQILAKSGLVSRYIAETQKIKTKKITPVYVMCEIPSNVLLADEFLEIFDGMSIGSNDLTQLTVGLDRDSGTLSYIANENNPAVKKLIEIVIKKCNERFRYIGICGQAPSDYPDFAEFLVEKGIHSISVNPDVVVSTLLTIAKKEGKTL